MNDKEKRIREQRLIEATRKGLTGLEGKFGTILRHLGQPIIGHGGGMYESNGPINVYDYLDEDEGETMGTLDEDTPIMEVGMVFDGMSSGVHLEILYKSIERELKVRWQGELVYAEVAGELECYVPSHVWESKVDYLFNVAKRREEGDRRQAVEENKQELQRQKLSFLDALRKRWGF